MQIPIDAAREHFLCLIEFQLLANARSAMFDFANITRAGASLRLFVECPLCLQNKST